MSSNDPTTDLRVVIDHLRDRWVALDTALRATIDQLDRHLEEFELLAERSMWVHRRVRRSVTGPAADESFEAFAELIGLDQVDGALCDLAGRIQAG